MPATSAFDSRGRLTPEAKNDLRKVLYQAVFTGGSKQLEEKPIPRSIP